jgi:hypothetical protein
MRKHPILCKIRYSVTLTIYFVSSKKILQRRMKIGLQQKSLIKLESLREKSHLGLPKI